VFEQKGEYLKALSYYEYMNQMKDSLFNLNTSRQLSELQTKYDSEQKERENQLLKKDVESKSLIIYSSIIIIVLLITFSIILYRFYRAKLKNNEILQELHQQLLEQKEELLSQSEDLHRANTEVRDVNENLERTVGNRTRQLQIQNEKLKQYSFSNAHRVRGPLARILGLLEIIEMEGDDNKDLKSNIKHLHLAAKELDDIIRELNKILEEDQ
jgi:signal transduction histidine kinase